MFRKSLSAFGIALGLALCGGATAVQAETIALSTQLNGKNEVPANASKATGRARVTFDTRSNKLSWTVAYRGLTPTAGHFHGPAAPGANAGVVVPFAGVDKSPIAGSSTLTAAQASDLLSGKWYVNLHSSAFGGGEIRGQIMPSARIARKYSREAVEQARTRQLNEAQQQKR